MDPGETLRLQELMRTTECPRGFACVQPGNTDVCKVKDWGVEGYVDCLDPRGRDCRFGILFGNGVLCKCPVGLHLARQRRT